MRHIACALILFLAGCTEPTEEVPEPVVVTDPNDYSYLDPSKDGEGYHLHDYWGGEQVLPLLSGTGSCLGCARASDEDVLIEWFRPDGGSVVPQGARWINVTATWTFGQGTTIDAVHLWVRPADAVDFMDAGQLHPGATLSYETNNSANDPPHTRLSGWQFMLVGHRADGEAAVEDWQVRMDVTVARGHTIEPWPPHPDVWGGATELALMDNTTTTAADIALPFRHSCDGPCLNRLLPILDGVIIPASASGITLEVRHEQGMPTPFRLLFHGGDTWELTSLEPVWQDAWSARYELEVTREIADSPYAKQSVWQFVLESDMPRPYAYSGTLQVAATLHR